MTTSDRNDPRLPRPTGPDETPVDQQPVYLVLSDEERAKGFVRPYRAVYRHVSCKVTPNGETTMALAIAETYARNPHFYTGTYCVHCRMHRPVGEHGEFTWRDGSKVGT
jgi:hypothetical protein